MGNKIEGLLVAPTEPNMLKKVGVVASIPEKHGVDLLWATKQLGYVGVQRKEITDFVASMHDGRLAKEISQMGDKLGLKVVMVEGFGTWTRDGEMAHGYVKINRQQIRAFLWSIRSKGVWVEWTENLWDTVQTLEAMVKWTRKDKHTALMERPGPKGGKWGRVTNYDYAIHVLTGFEGIGVETAAKIIRHFQGVPLAWTTDQKGLTEVPGIGEKKAEQLIKSLTKDD